MKKWIRIPLISSALVGICTIGLQAQIILFNGSNDTVYMATTDNDNVTLTKNSGHIHLSATAAPSPK